MSTELPQINSIESEFQELVSEWKQDTQHLSRMDRIVCHPAYLRIIGMGKEALSLIFAELDREPDYWFVALSSITGINPVSKDAQVGVDEMARAWLKWGRDHGYTS